MTNTSDRPGYIPLELTLRTLSIPNEPQPGGRTPAPGELALVQAFVNSFWDLERHGQERWGTAEELADWLIERGLLAPRTRLRRDDLRRALDVREGLRSLLFANNGAGVGREAIERLNAALRGCRLFVQLDPLGSPDFSTDTGDFDAVLALVAATVAAAQLDGRWSRLKACRGEHCGWVFYDHSRNQAGSWCAMSVCGSRAKARHYRTRKRRSASQDSGNLPQ